MAAQPCEYTKNVELLDYLLIMFTINLLGKKSQVLKNFFKTTEQNLNKRKTETAITEYLKTITENIIYQNM
jgi:hypothetical protein